MPAPGKPGMVMTVFTLPSYEFVFKVIRDRFAPPKNTTAAEVRERYRQVLRHDRVGRLVDFQEFEHLDFPRRRFSDETPRGAAARGRRDRQARGRPGDRRSPLHRPPGDAARCPSARRRRRRRRLPAVIDWGWTLKELAAANIFAGDILLKNFGVTRHGRVVFYDYDELCPLSDCRFRRIPPPRTPEDEMAAEPWFSVAEEDVFPEEFPAFLGLDGELFETFRRHHADLFDVEFWRDAQQRNRGGELLDFFPYSAERRLRRARRPPPGSRARLSRGRLPQRARARPASRECSSSRLDRPADAIVSSWRKRSRWRFS